MDKSNFIITSDNRVYYGKAHIGEINYIEAGAPDSKTEIACSLAGGEFFSHKPVYDTESACEIIYNKFYSKES